MKNFFSQKVPKAVMGCFAIALLITPTLVSANIFNDAASFIGLIPAAVTLGEGPPGVPTSEPALRAKETCTVIPFIHLCAGPSLDHFALLIMRAIINKMTDNAVTFINNGFESEGGPGYAVDLKNTILKEADVQAGNIIYGAGLGRLCSPFQVQVRLALIARQATQRSSGDSSSQPGSCTLSQVSNNIQGLFDGDFVGGGGWDAWYTMTQDPYGNPYSAFLNTKISIDSAQAEAIGLKKEQLQWNQGFFSTQECTDWQDPDPTKMVGGGIITNADGSISAIPITLAPATKDTPGAICAKKGPVKTPGTVVADSLMKLTNSKTDQLNIASNFNQIVVALANQLERLVFSKAKGIFANEASNNGVYNENSSSGADAAFQNGGSCFPDKATVNVGDKVTWTYVGIGGDGVTYDWTGSDGLSGQASSASINYLNAGRGKDGQVTLTTPATSDRAALTKIIKCAQKVDVNKYPPLSISCKVTNARTGQAVQNITRGTEMTWEIEILGGSGQIHKLDFDEGFAFNMNQNNKNKPQEWNIALIIPNLSQFRLGNSTDLNFVGGPSITNKLPIDSGGSVRFLVNVLYTQTGTWNMGFNQIVDTDDLVKVINDVKCDASSDVVVIQ